MSGWGAAQLWAHISGKVRNVLSGITIWIDSNLELEKVSPEIKQTDTVSGENSRVVRGANAVIRYNKVDYTSAGSVKLLLHMDGADGGTTFMDSSPLAHVVTVGAGTVVTRTANPKFGTAAGSWEAADSYLKVAYNSAFNLGTNDVTLAMWSNTPDVASYGVLTSRDAGMPAFPSFQINSGRLRLYIPDSSGYGIANNVDVGAVSAGVYNHFALTRSGDVWRAFINGALLWTTTNSAAVRSDATDLIIGDYKALAGYDYLGLGDEIYLNVGHAEWTAPFTPPAAPYSTASQEVIVHSSADGVDPGDIGIETFGDGEAKTGINGRTIRFYINDNEVMQIQGNGLFDRVLVGDAESGITEADVLNSNSGGGIIGVERRDTSVISGNKIGEYSFYGGELGVGSKVGMVRVDADAAWTNTSSPTRLEFFTCKSGATSIIASAPDFTISTTGLFSAGALGYEAQVVADNDIPNKKYVDDKIAVPKFAITVIDHTDSPYTVLATDYEIRGDTTGGAITVDLPAGVDEAAYRMLNTGSGGNLLTTNPNGTENLIGANSGFALKDWEALYIAYESTKGWG